MMEIRPVVFNYLDPRQYLRDVLASKQRQNSMFSVRAWAQQMGLKGHSALVFFLKGQRQIKPSHVPALLKGLRLPENEEKFWSALVHYDCAESEAEKSYYLQQLKLLHPAQEFCVLDVGRFRLIADWYHMAILEMTQLKDFVSDASWIQRRLGFEVELDVVEGALNRLINLKLLRWEEGRLVKTNERLTTPKDNPSECVREHHKQVLQNGFRAIDQQDVSERFFNSCALTIDAAKLPEAKELIRKFREDMTKLMTKCPGDETYQLSVQFFKLTESISQFQTSKEEPCSNPH